MHSGAQSAVCIFAYVISFVCALDRTRPAYLSCKQVGKVNNFDFGLAYQAIDQAKAKLPA